MRIFLDANILFSAAKSDGAVATLLSMLAAAGHVACVDPYVVEEARRNLAAKAPGRIQRLQQLLLSMEHGPLPSPTPQLEASLKLPPKDRPVLASAIARSCDVLLTGDRTHFGALYEHTVQGVTMHSPRSLAEKLFVR